MLYQVATGALSPGDIAHPLRSVLGRHRNTTVILGEAIGIDPEKRQVLLSDSGPVDYDTLIVATGAHHSYFDHPEWAPLRPGPQDRRGRHRDPPADPHRVRGRGTGSRSGTPARVDDVRARRRRPDRGRARGRARRDRPRHAQARVPGDPPGRREDHPRRGDGSRPAGLSTGPLGVGAVGSSSGSGSTSGRRPGSIDIDERQVRVLSPMAPRRPSRPGPCSGRPASRRRLVRRGRSAAATGAADRSRRAGHRRAGPHDPRASGDLRRRRCGGRCRGSEDRADTGRRPGRHPGRLVCREGHPPADPGPAIQAVPLLEPRATWR